jgi:hypothetical protein
MTAAGRARVVTGHPRVTSRAAAARHNLPTSITSFIGREQELASVQACITNARLVTLTGVSGCGKTRLALEVACSVLTTYPDGVWHAELAP